MRRCFKSEEKINENQKILGSPPWPGHLSKKKSLPLRFSLNLVSIVFRNDFLQRVTLNKKKLQANLNWFVSHSPAKVFFVVMRQTKGGASQQTFYLAAAFFWFQVLFRN